MYVHVYITMKNMYRLMITIFVSSGQLRPSSGTRKLPPIQKDSLGKDSLGPHYEWVDVGMLDYNAQTKLYLVKRKFVPEHIANKNKRSGSEGDSSDSGNEGDNDSTANTEVTIDEIHYWVPRIRLLFSAEDPRVFANRVSYAYKLRQNTEALLR